MTSVLGGGRRTCDSTAPTPTMKRARASVIGTSTSPQYRSIGGNILLCTSRASHRGAVSIRAARCLGRPEQTHLGEVRWSRRPGAHRQISHPATLSMLPIPYNSWLPSHLIIALSSSPAFHPSRRLHSPHAPTSIPSPQPSLHWWLLRWWLLRRLWCMLKHLLALVICIERAAYLKLDVVEGTIPVRAPWPYKRGCSVEFLRGRACCQVCIEGVDVEIRLRMFECAWIGVKVKYLPSPAAPSLSHVCHPPYPPAIIHDKSRLSVSKANAMVAES